jgi:hypothetical protein
MCIFGVEVDAGETGDDSALRNELGDLAQRADAVGGVVVGVERAQL